MNYYSTAKSSVSGLAVIVLIAQLIFPLTTFANATSTPQIEETVQELEEQAFSEQTLEDESRESEEQQEPILEALNGTSTIDTGDATAASSIETEVNTFEVEIETASSSENASTTDPVPSVGNAPELEVNATNTATSTTNATTTANTGVNQTSGGTATITTGDAIAYTDILNVVNTNIIDSTGLIAFINETLGHQNFYLQDDFSDIFEAFLTAQSTTNCASNCGNSNLTVNATNTANIYNDVTVAANTGGNTAYGQNSSVQTGDAYASANIINLANTNITDSRYLLLVFNNFSDYSGDIVLPNSDFFQQYFSQGVGAGTSVNTTNSATIANNSTVVADTGNNSGSNIDTGNAYARGDVSNTVNQSIVGAGSFNMLIRVHGNWTGEITGLPEGMTWQLTDRGIEITSNLRATRALGATTVNTNNNANIRNDVRVYALTGDNMATGDGTVQTGNAYADSSIMNIANTNVISSNWTNLIFTIFGNWNGNLSFGQTDLWLGIQAHSNDSPIMPKSTVAYTFTVFNRGDVTARNVKLDTTFNTTNLNFGANPPAVDLGDIAPGQTKEFSYTADVTTALSPHEENVVPLRAVVTSDDRDANPDDNEDEATIYVGMKKSNNNSTKPRFPANIEISKTASQSTADVGDTVAYNITLFNHGGQLYDALLVDTMYGPTGEIVFEQSWPLDTIYNWETINVDYEIQFTEELSTGRYTNVAEIVGFHTSARPDYQIPYQSALAEAIVQFGPEQLVLGEATCPPYITEYLKYGMNNSTEEVIKLQQFLVEYLSADIEITGQFDLKTEIAVRDFQIKHRDEILDPWGISSDTGFVYYTTQKKINEIMCQGMTSFPLTLQQKNEIDQYRATLQFGFARVRNDENE